MKLLPAAGLVLAGIYILTKVSKASAFQALQFSAGDFNVSQQGLNTLLTFNVVVTNPTSTAITVNSIVANLSVNASPIGQATSFITTLIAPNKQTAIPVMAVLYDLPLINSLLKIFANPTSSDQATLSGTVNVEDLTVPLSLTYPLI